MYEGMFIVGVTTPFGQASYHYDLDYWKYFKCKEMDRAPKYDGHTPEEAVQRIFDTSMNLDHLDAPILHRDFTFIRKDPMARGSDPEYPWCENKIRCVDDGSIICLAHMVEGRALTCPYKTAQERANAEHPCSDYEERKS